MKGLRLVGAICAAIIFGTIVGIVANKVITSDQTATSAKHQAESNKDAILKSCVLLNNAIIQSNQASQQPRQNGKKNSTQILVTIILRNATTEERRQFREASRDRPGLDLIPCKTVADNPDSIVALPRPQATPNNNVDRTRRIPPNKR